MQKRRGLGRGLEVLLSEPVLQSPGENSITTVTEKSPTDKTLQSLQLAEIVISPYQPRREMPAETLQELADSIQAQGIIQPIIVRRVKDQYELIAGERRWRAAKIAGLDTIPALVYTVSNEKAMLCALIENLQRENLSALEEAEALQKIAEATQFTHEKLAASVGKSRSVVTNLLRLLQLEPQVKTFLQERKLEVGHAKVLLSLPHEQQLNIAHKVIKNQLSVRATENLIQFLQQPRTPKSVIKDPVFRQAQQQLTRKYNTRVSVVSTRSGKGKIVVSFFDKNDLERLLNEMI